MLSRKIQEYEHCANYSKRFSDTEVFSYTYFNHAFSSENTFKQLIFKADKIEPLVDQMLMNLWTKIETL
jgi:hypothetical protein